MSDAIENIKRVPGVYAHLFEIQSYTQQMDALEPEDIALEVCRQSRNLQFGRKVVYFDSRRLNQDEHDLTSKLKAETHCKSLGLFLDGGSVVSSVVTAFFSGGVIGGLSTAATQGFNSASGYQSRANDGSIQRLDFRYQGIGSTIGDHSKQLQDADQAHSQDNAMIDRIVQASHRSFEIAVTGQ